MNYYIISRIFSSIYANDLLYSYLLNVPNWPYRDALTMHSRTGSQHLACWAVEAVGETRWKFKKPRWNTRFNLIISE